MEVIFKEGEFLIGFMTSFKGKTYKNTISDNLNAPLTDWEFCPCKVAVDLGHYTRHMALSELPRSSSCQTRVAT